MRAICVCDFGRGYGKIAPELRDSPSRTGSNVDKLVNDMTITKEPINQEDAKLVALAKTDIAFGPRYIDGDEGVFEQSTSDVEKFFALEGIPTSRVPQAKWYMDVVEKSASIPCVLPMIIISSACLLQNPALVEMILTVVSNYINHHFANFMGGEKKVTLKIIKGNTKITYEGTPDGLKEIKPILEATDDG